MEARESSLTLFRRNQYPSSLDFTPHHGACSSMIADVSKDCLSTSSSRITHRGAGEVTEPRYMGSSMPKDDVWLHAVWKSSTFQHSPSASASKSLTARRKNSPHRSCQSSCHFMEPQILRPMFTGPKFRTADANLGMQGQQQSKGAGHEQVSGSTQSRSCQTGKNTAQQGLSRRQ